jgi:hypothetical protein
MSLWGHFKRKKKAVVSQRRNAQRGAAPLQFGPAARQPNDAWAMAIDVFGVPRFIGYRGEYAQPQNAQMPGSYWPVTGQLNLSSGGEYWGYSYGDQTIGTDWAVVEGNPPQGGFSTPVSIIPVSNQEM